jgi:CBS domain-containing protein
MKKVVDVMKKEVSVLSANASVQEAAEKMRALEIGALPVCDGDQVVGMLTDRDITVRVTAKGKDPHKTPVRSVMTKKVVSCSETQNLAEISDLMSREQVGRVVVLSPDNQLMGLLSLGDITHCLGANRLSDVVSSKMPSSRKRFLLTGLGTAAGAAGLFAGFRFLRNKPEIFNRLFRRNNRGNSRTQKAA